MATNHFYNCTKGEQILGIGMVTDAIVRVLSYPVLNNCTLGLSGPVRGFFQPLNSVPATNISDDR